MTLLAIAIAGAMGALARYGFSGLIHQRLGTFFPWGTLGVNLLGCFLLGLLTELGRRTGWIPPQFQAAAGIGFLGSFTTFSTFSVETWRAWEAGDIVGAAGNVGAHIIGGLAAVIAGVVTARLVSH